MVARLLWAEPGSARGAGGSEPGLAQRSEFTRAKARERKFREPQECEQSRETLKEIKNRTFARIIRNKHIIYKRTYDPVKHEFVGDETLWAGKYEKAEFANGIGEEARFNQPCQGVFDEDGNLYVSDRDNNCIRKITPDGNVTIYAGNRSEGLVNGLPLKSSFRRPEGLTRSKDGVIYVADHDNHVIRKIVVE